MREPLADRMRPRTLEDFVGQDHIIAAGRLLHRSIQMDMLSSLILCGPPGCGKTTLARIIANTTKKKFHSLNAVLGGVAEVRKAVAEAQQRYDTGQGTILFVDEVHRWNTAQQDALLPWVENGTVVFVGATTHNPFFEVNNALVSRSRVFKLKPLTTQDLRSIIQRVLTDKVYGYGKYQITLNKDAEEHLLRICDGDARSLMNALQLAIESSEHFPSNQAITIDLSTAEESIQHKAVLYDKDGDWHFDSISAFIKSIRGSDPDAALYWTARMIAAGEDCRYILRRMLILAAEDIGLADPIALVVVQAAAAAFERVGLPEGQIILSQAVLYMANAPKSNSVLGYFDALKAVEEEKHQEPPAAIQDSNRDKEGFGHGKGYLYPHAYQDHWVAQHYLPEALQGRVFYQPSTQGKEGTQVEEIIRRRELQLATAELMNHEEYSWGASPSARWRWRTNANSTMLQEIRSHIFGGSENRPRTDRVLLYGEQLSFLMWEALRKYPEGHTTVVCIKKDESQKLSSQINPLTAIEKPTMLYGDDITVISQLANKIKCEQILIHRALCHLLSHTGVSEIVPRLTALTRCVLPEGKIMLAEPLPYYRAKLSEIALGQGVDTKWIATLREIEGHMQGEDLMLNLDSVVELIAQVPVLVPKSKLVTHYNITRCIGEELLEYWFGAPKSMYARNINAVCSPHQIKSLKAALGAGLVGKEIAWKVGVAFMEFSVK